MCEGCDGEVEDRDVGICVVDSFLGIAEGLVYMCPSSFPLPGRYRSSPDY